MPLGTLSRHDNKIWYVHWTENRRSRRQSTHCTKRGEAETFLRNWQKIHDEGRAEPKLTIAYLWMQYDERHLQRKGLPAKSSYCAWLRLAPFFGAMLPEEINSLAIDRYCKLRTNGERKVTASTVRRELTSLIACLNWAAHRAQRLIKADEAPFIELPPRGAPRDRWLRPHEIVKLFDAAKAGRVDGRIGRSELFLWLALETTARKSAILGLTWDRVDLERGMIDYREPNRPITKKRRVAVPVSQALRPILEQAYAERNPADTIVLGGGTVKMEYHVNRVAKRAGLTGVTPHVLRHTAATLMARNGVPLWHIASILGNSVAMIESVYAKHASDMQRVAIESIRGAEWRVQELGAPSLSATDKADVSDSVRCDPLLSKTDETDRETV